MDTFWIRIPVLDMLTEWRKIDTAGICQNLIRCEVLEILPLR